MPKPQGDLNSEFHRWAESGAQGPISPAKIHEMLTRGQACSGRFTETMGASEGVSSLPGFHFKRAGKGVYFLQFDSLSLRQ